MYVPFLVKQFYPYVNHYFQVVALAGVSRIKTYFTPLIHVLARSWTHYLCCRYGVHRAELLLLPMPVCVANQGLFSTCTEICIQPELERSASDNCGTAANLYSPGFVPSPDFNRFRNWLCAEWTLISHCRKPLRELRGKRLISFIGKLVSHHA